MEPQTPTDQHDTNHRSAFKPFQFQDWPVYEKSIHLVKLSDRISDRAVTFGKRALADQLRQASQSIVLNIAEGSSRYTPKDKLSFLRISKGSLFECVAAVDIAKEIEILTEAERSAYCNLVAEIGKMLTGMLKAVSKWKDSKRQNFNELID